MKQSYDKYKAFLLLIACTIMFVKLAPDGKSGKYPQVSWASRGRGKGGGEGGGGANAPPFGKSKIRKNYME